MSRALLAVCIAAASAGCMSSNPFFSLKPTKPVDISDSSGPAAAPDHKTLEAQTSPSSPTADSRSIEIEPDQNAATIEALRHKSEVYAQALEMMIRDRAANPPPKSSDVQWIDPNEFKVQLGDGSTAGPGPSTQPTNAIVKVSGDKPGASPATRPAEVLNDSNTPLALGDVSSKEAVALLTPQPAPDESVMKPAQPIDMRADASELEKRLARRVRENPRDLSNHLAYQMLLFLMDEPVPNLASLAPLPQEDRELMTALLDGLSNLRATLRRDSNLLVSEKIKPISELADRLRSSAELTIPMIALCSRVEGFGRYETMQPRFIAGKESQTIVYCEIENFSSQLNQQQWETNLSMELSVFTEAGQQVINEAPVAITDTSRTRRHDFFVRKLIRIPTNLPIGRYVLKTTIVDTQSNRVAESSMDLQLVAQ